MQRLFLRIGLLQKVRYDSKSWCAISPRHDYAFEPPVKVIKVRMIPGAGGSTKRSDSRTCRSSTSCLSYNTRPKPQYHIVFNQFPLFRTKLWNMWTQVLSQIPQNHQMDPAATVPTPWRRSSLEGSAESMPATACQLW